MICAGLPSRWFTGRKQEASSSASMRDTELPLANPIQSCPIESRIPRKAPAVENPKRHVIILSSSPLTQCRIEFQNNAPEGAIESILRALQERWHWRWSRPLLFVAAQRGQPLCRVSSLASSARTVLTTAPHQHRGSSSSDSDLARRRLISSDRPLK